MVGFNFMRGQNDAEHAVHVRTAAKGRTRTPVARKLNFARWAKPICRPDHGLIKQTPHWRLFY